MSDCVSIFGYALLRNPCQMIYAFLPCGAVKTGISRKTAGFSIVTRHVLHLKRRQPLAGPL